jgi:hypothetical protein
MVMLKIKRNMRKAAILALVVSTLLVPSLVGATAIPADTSTDFFIPQVVPEVDAKAVVNITWGSGTSYWYEFEFTSLYYISEIRIHGEDTSGDYIHPDTLESLSGIGADVTLVDRETSQSIAIVPNSGWLYPNVTTDIVRLVYDSAVSTHRIALSAGATGGAFAWVEYEIPNINEVRSVPEPTTLLLLGLGMLTLGALSRKKV